MRPLIPDAKNMRCRSADGIQTIVTGEGPTRQARRQARTGDHSPARILVADVDVRRYQKSKFRLTFINRALRIEFGRSQVAYAVLAEMTASELSALKISRLSCVRYRAMRNTFPIRRSSSLRRSSRLVSSSRICTTWFAAPP